VDAYIRLELDRWDVVECYDERGRNIYLYPDEDLVIKPYMKAVFSSNVSPNYGFRFLLLALCFLAITCLFLVLKPKRNDIR